MYNSPLICCHYFEIYNGISNENNIENKHDYILNEVLKSAPLFISRLYNLAVEIYENGKEMTVVNIEEYNIVNPEQETIDELNFLKDVTENDACKNILKQEIDKKILKYTPNIFNFFREINDIFTLLELKRSKTRMQY